MIISTLCLLLLPSSLAFLLPLRPAVTPVASLSTIHRPWRPQNAGWARSRHHHRQERSHVLWMGWGPEPVWTSATVTSNTDACASGLSVLLTVQVSAETTANYTQPGQYVQVRNRTNKDATPPLFLAIASPPQKDGDWEFLVKKKGEDNDWLTSITADTALDISQVMGAGYRIQDNLEGYKYDFPTQNILLFAAGSGLAPIKAALESPCLGIVDDKGGRTARLYYGERHEADLCFVDRFAAWEAAGVEIVPVLSQPPPSWHGRTGYVQNALEEDGIAIPRNSGALLCGMKGMHEAVKELLLKAGVFDGRVLFNY